MGTSATDPEALEGPSTTGADTRSGIRRSNVRPVVLQRRVLRFACTFLPSLVPKRRGVTRAAHWESHPTIEAFNGVDPLSQAMLDQITSRVPDPGAPILDLGCNVGRHMRYLHDHGYRNLRGVDFCSKAIADMEKHHPALYRDSRLHIASFEDYLCGNPEPAELVYTHGATFELVHPRFPLIKRVCAIARRYVVMVIHEWGHCYPRLWGYEFAREGFELVLLKRQASTFEKGSMSLLVFERMPG